MGITALQVLVAEASFRKNKKNTPVPKLLFVEHRVVAIGSVWLLISSINSMFQKGGFYFAQALHNFCNVNTTSCLSLCLIAMTYFTISGAVAAIYSASGKAPTTW